MKKKSLQENIKSNKIIPKKDNTQKEEKLNYASYSS